MRRTLFAFLAICAAIPTIAAAQSIDERQDNINRRIDDGVRAGTLTRQEAERLRGEFNNIARLENDYRRDGRLTDSERRDLNNRFDDLSRRIQTNNSDTVVRADAIYERRDRQEQNIQDGIRGGGLTRGESDRLWADLNAFDQVLRDYRRSGDGLDLREREDLNRRLDQLGRRIEAERKDGEKRGQYERGYDDRNPYDNGRGGYDNRGNNGYGDRNDRPYR